MAKTRENEVKKPTYSMQEMNFLVTNCKTIKEFMVIGDLLHDENERYPIEWLLSISELFKIKVRKIIKKYER